MLNKVFLIGRLGKNPEVKYIQTDVPVARFSLATSENYKTPDGERKELTEWHNIIAWRGLAKTAEQYLQKGMLIFVEGRIQTRRWTDQNNVERYSTDILADSFKMLERKGERDANSGQAPLSSYTAPPENFKDNSFQNTNKFPIEENNSENLQSQNLSAIEDNDDLPF